MRSGKVSYILAQLYQLLIRNDFTVYESFCFFKSIIILDFNLLMAGQGFESQFINIPLEEKSNNIINDLFNSKKGMQRMNRSFNRWNEVCFIWIFFFFWNPIKSQNWWCCYGIFIGAYTSWFFLISFLKRWLSSKLLTCST